jgi:hypothetical protein
MTRLRAFTTAGALLFVATASAEEYQAIFWNLESGESSSETIASQMVAKGDVAFWGLSEVANQAFLNTLETALEAANPKVDYVTKLSEEGAGDRLAILFRSDRLKAVPYAGNATVDDIGDNFFEVDSINVGGTIRPALGIQLTGESGDTVVALVNHWKCCADGPDRRELQAIQMNAFAVDTPGIPIISGGDFNIPIDHDGQSEEDAFEELGHVWEYKQPQPDVGTHKSGSVLDAVFVTNSVAGWESSTTILERDGNVPATTATFGDNDSDTDHRPLLLVVQSDAGDRIDALREAIAEMEATLAALKAELARLEDANRD